jgi:hypothetical protein
MYMRSSNSRSIASAPVPKPTAAPAFTLQQIITMIDARLSAVETENASKKNQALAASQIIPVAAPVGLTEINAKLDFYAEYVQRTDIQLNAMIEEIDMLKNTIMGVQQYTMTVNTKLVDYIITKAIEAEPDEVVPDVVVPDEVVPDEVVPDEVVPDVVVPDVAGSSQAILGLYAVF